MNYTIKKEVMSGSGSTVFTNIKYRIIMKNNSESTGFEEVDFRDTYDTRELKFDFASLVSGRRIDINGNIVTEKMFLLGGSNGELTHENLAEELGVLRPGETYILEATFLATSSGTKCNTGFWNPNNFGEMKSTACTSIKIEVPNTDL
jgi:hypothetical protein